MHTKLYCMSDYIFNNKFFNKATLEITISTNSSISTVLAAIAREKNALLILFYGFEEGKM